MEVQVAVAVLVTVIPLQGLFAYELVLTSPQVWQSQKGMVSQSVPSGANVDMVAAQLGPPQVPPVFTPG